MEDYAASDQSGGNATCEPSYVRNYTVGSTIKKPIDDEIIAPFVKMWFKGGGDENNPMISVGNESCPDCGDKHSAVITSFEFGVSDGIHTKIEILDEEGGSFEKIAEHLFKRVDKASEDMSLYVQWGWVMSSCMESGKPRIRSSNVMVFTLVNIEVKYSKAAVRYTLTGSDMMQAVLVSNEKDIIGSELHREKLDKAIEKLFEKNEPKIYCKRARREKDGNIAKDDKAYKWKDAQDIGTAWAASGQNKLAALLKWTENFRTSNDKATIPIWDTSNQNERTLLLMEVEGDCNINTPDSTITFIVGGGKCSSVIDFSTNINWVAALAKLAVGGQAGSPADGKPLQKENEKPGGCKVATDSVGKSQITGATRTSLDINGFKETAKEQSKNQNVNSAGDLWGPTAITAQLQIQGDPDPQYTSVFGKGTYVSIVALNPWHIRSGRGGTTKCPDWTIKPATNSVISNKYWMIRGLNHQIKEGSYTTTLDLFLAAPGINMSSSVPPGGDNNATWAKDA